MHSYMCHSSAQKVSTVDSWSTSLSWMIWLSLRWSHRTPASFHDAKLHSRIENSQQFITLVFGRCCGVGALWWYIFGDVLLKILDYIFQGSKKHISLPSVNDLAQVLMSLSIQTLKTTTLFSNFKTSTGRRWTVYKTGQGVELRTSVKQHQLVVRTGFEPVAFGFQVQRTNRSATLSTQIIECSTV